MQHIISIENMELKYFLKLAETLNFSSAAKELFITQSTLSQQILNLEREFDQPLFVRNSHEVQLTEAGRLLMPHAQESINAAENCITLVQELKHMLVGELNVGVTFSFSNIMAETMAEFLKKYPNVKLNVCYDSMAVLMEKLQHHDLDLVLAFKPLKTDNRIDSEVLFHTHASAIVNEFHPLARLSKVTLEELQNPEDTAHARIYDRLTEMCTPVRITGENFRKARAREKMEQLKTLLNRKESL